MEKTSGKKDRLNYKGSSYKGKGNINTDAATFNKPRKAPRRHGHK